MFRCPNCGRMVYGSTRYSENFVCPNCSARLRVRASSGFVPFAFFFLFLWLIALPLTWGFGFFWLFILFCCFPAMHRKVEVVQLNTPSVRRTSFDRSEQTVPSTTPSRQSTTEQLPTPAPSQRTSRYCGYCGAAIFAPNWKFCQNCGASLSTDALETPRLSERNTPRRADNAGRCMVCGLNLGRNEPLLYCPHCGNGAHRTHLLEWLHVKKYCPVCGQHLTEQELE